MNQKPNVILIVTDDQGYGDISAHGNPWLETPNLDYLHDNSVRLESFHTDPLCAPTRGALMSGRYSFGAGVYSTLTGRYYMKPELKTMADYFSESGYATGMFGKWHLGDTYKYRPHERGFDVAYSFGGGVIGEIPDHWGNDYFDDTYTVNGEPKQFNGYCTDNWFSSAIEFIDSSSANEKPFFCYLPTNAPHGPFNVDRRYYQKHLDKGVEPMRARFYGMIESIDENIGKLIKHLKENNLYDNTIITFFGDNGTASGCNIDKDGHVVDGYNAGMRGKKGHTYEGAHRNMCFMTSPNNILGRNRAVHGLTTQFDLLATYIDACDLIKGDQYDELDGVSMFSALHNGEYHINHGRTVVVHNMQRDMPQKFKDYTVLRDNMRLVRPLTPESNPLARGNFAEPIILAPEIYDLAKDPSERNDIYSDNVLLANELTLFYEDWYDSRVDYAMQYSPIFIDPNTENVLTCHAWHDCYAMCFSQTHVRKGIDGNGFFAIKVLHGGKYEIELRRWPHESQIALNGSCQSEASTDRIYIEKPAGKAYNIEKAQLLILGEKYECKVSAKDKSAKFAVDLPVGSYNLRTRFVMDDLKTIGAYYLYIKHLPTATLMIME